jgi:hypothetical protein
MVLLIFVAKHAIARPWIVWDGATFHKATSIRCLVPFETVNHELDGPIAKYCIRVIGKIEVVDGDEITIVEV